MKILVTGGSGFLGSHIKAFFDADDFSRRSGFDVLNLNDVRRVGEYDVVIHLAAELSKTSEAAGQVFLTNVEGTINVLREVREGAVFILASTKDVYGRFADNYREVPESCPTLYSGQSPLEWSKLIAERYVEYYAHTRKFRSCIFRLSTVYARASEGNTPGFVTHYADAINEGEPIRLPGGGRPRRDLLHVNDLSSACKAFIGSAITHGLYNLGGGRENALSLRELLTKLEEVSGLQAIIDEELPLPDPVPLNYVSDIGLVTRELDWNPSTSLDTGLRDLFR
ncbi:MAG TPA: NAD-dependent epimerase/dehydratase family protein [Pyrinomonadaceae bacterium]|jgi:nucleoside-diphosphate-sugar epimerase